MPRTKSILVVALAAVPVVVLLIVAGCQRPIDESTAPATPKKTQTSPVGNGAWEIEMGRDLTNPPLTNVPPDVDVEVFGPQSDVWITMKRSEVKPGQQFLLKSGIAKQGPGTALHDLYVPVDMVQLAEAYRPVQKNQPSRRARPDEFVYVIADDPFAAGFKPLAFLRPSQRFRFQGHIYAIREGSGSATMLIEDIGETIDDYPAITGRSTAHVRQQPNSGSK